MSRPESWLRSIEVIESLKDFLGDRCVGVGFGWSHATKYVGSLHRNHYAIEDFSTNTFRRRLT